MGEDAETVRTLSQLQRIPVASSEADRPAVRQVQG